MKTQIHAHVAAKVNLFNNVIIRYILMLITENGSSLLFNNFFAAPLDL